MTISIKEYAAQAGISVQAAHKRFKSARYARFLTVDGSGRKAVNTAIFDLEPGFKPDSTDSTEITPEVERISTNDSTFSTDMTDTVEDSTTDSTDSVDRMVESLKTDSTFSTNSTTELNHDAAILAIKLEYAQRDNERLESHVEALRQQVDDMRVQIAAKDNQIAALNERLRESHILIQSAQQKRRFPLLDIFRRGKGDGVNE